MTDVEKFPFGELERDGIIRADWGAWHPSICDQSDRLGSEANPETTLCMRLFLRSDTKQERAERKEWPNKLLRFKTLKCLKVNGCTPELFESICMLPALRRRRAKRIEVARRTVARWQFRECEDARTHCGSIRATKPLPLCKRLLPKQV
jgi:hypothetical protein